MFEINKTQVMTPVFKLNANLHTSLTVSHAPELEYECVERNFNVSISDSHGEEESETTKFLLQYDGRYAAVTWDHPPSEDEVSEVSEFIFGNKSFVEVIVQLNQVFHNEDYFGEVHMTSKVIAEEVEEAVFTNDGVRNPRSREHSMAYIMSIAKSLEEKLIASL